MHYPDKIWVVSVINGITASNSILAVDDSLSEMMVFIIIALSFDSSILFFIELKKNNN